jgi:WD40 repeat protein
LLPGDEPVPEAEPAPPSPVVEPAPISPPSSPEPSHPGLALKPKYFRNAIVAFTVLCLVASTLVMIKVLSDDSDSSGGTSAPFPTMITGVSPDVGSIQFSPNGNLLATTAGTTTELWNVGEAEKIGSRSDARSVAFSPDSKKLAVLRGDSLVQLWDVPDNKAIAELGRYEGLAVFAFSPDGAVLAVAGTLVAKEAYDNPIVLWDTASGKQLRTLAGHTNGVQSMVFSAHGVLASGAAGGAVRLWDVKTGQNTAAYTAGYIVAFSNDGQTLATSSEFASDQKVQLWNIATGTVRTSFGKGEPVAFGQDGGTLLVRDRWNEHPNAALWDVRSAMSITTVTEHATLSPDGKTLAHGSSTGTVTLFDVAGRTPSRTLTGHTGAVTDLAFRPDGKLLATSGKDGTIRLWPIA